MPTVSAKYCATDAVAVNEMSMWPATSTTSRPDARMPTKEFEVSRSNRFCTVRKLSVVSDNASDSTTMTASSQNSWLRRKRASAALGIDQRLQFFFGRLVRQALGGEPPAAHHEHAMGVIENLRDLVGDQQDC